MRKNKLTQEKILEIRNIYLTTNRTMEDIGGEFGVNKVYVHRHLKDWGCDDKNQNIGENNKWAKLTKYQVKKIIVTYLKGGITQKKLAEQYNVHQTTIWAICNGKSWKNIFQKKRPFNKEIISIKK